MKLLSLVIVALALAAGILYFSFGRREARVAPHSTETSAQVPQPPAAPTEPPGTRPVALVEPDPTERLLRQLEKILTRLERLEGSVSEVRTEISIRSDERSRVAVSPYSSLPRSRLDEEDLTSLRVLIREGLLNEAWKRRQEELVGVGRHLALQLQLETRFIDPMIEVLCVDGLQLFNLERELAEHNHDRSLARRRVGDFRLARRKLREDLGSTLRNDELAARVFLHVASGGEVAAISMERERLLATEKDWLR